MVTYMKVLIAPSIPEDNILILGRKLPRYILLDAPFSDHQVPCYIGPIADAQYRSVANSPSMSEICFPSLTKTSLVLDVPPGG